MKQDNLPLEIQASDSPFTKEDYENMCGQRWGGIAYINAQENWKHWRSLHDLLEKSMKLFLDQDRTLNEFLWELQVKLEPDLSVLAPLLDFEERHQKVHLRRGLYQYCQLILKYLNNKER